MKLASGVQTALASESAYQLVMVTALLELLLLGALLPRSPDGDVPVCFAIVSGVRFLALLALAGLLAAQPNTVKPVGALIALSLWGAMLAPPELWAAAAELKRGLPVTLISSIALSVGLYAALRWQPVIGWGFLGLIFLALYVQDWQLEPLEAALIAVIALGAGLWLLAVRANRLEQGEPA